MAVVEPHRLGTEDITYNFFTDLYKDTSNGFLILFTIDNRTKKKISYSFDINKNGLKTAARKAADLSVKANLEIYYGVGLQEAPSRTYERGTAKNVIAIPGLWMDIDIKGDGHKVEALPKDIKAAKEFALNAFPLPPSKLVFTGGGLHAYWLFREPLTLDNEEEREEAAGLSRSFQRTIQEKAKENGWVLDITADLARVLRIPSTYNRKKEPIKVEVLKDNPDYRYSPSDFEPYLLEETTTANDYGDDLDWAGEDFPPADLNKILAKCRWLRHCRDDTDKLTEPELYAMDSIVSRCINGREIIHEWSRKHPKYNRDEVDKKIDHALKAADARTCENIKANFGDYCRGCRVKVKSPIALSLARYNYFDKQGTFIPKKLADDIMSEYYIKYAASDFWIYENGVYSPKGEKTISQLAQRKLGNATRTSRIRETSDFIKRATYADLPAPDTNLINLLNGRLNWRTGKLLPHSPEQFEIVQIPVKYDPKAKCPTFDKYLKTTLDDEAALLALEILGYCLIPDTTHEKAVMLTGAGRNGKSIFLYVIQSLLGLENVSNVALQDLAENKFRAAELVGKLANIFADLDSRALSSSSQLKMLTSGDTIAAERKFKEPFQFTNYARLIFSANTLPRSSDNTFAFYERWLIIPFENTFDKNNPNTDPRLREKLSNPYELSGILNKALEGLRRLDKAGKFTEPTSVIKALYTYRLENDSVAGFCEECIEIDPEGFVKKQDFYRIYKEWCYQNGLTPVSQKKLNPRLSNLYTNLKEKREKNNGARLWGGIKVNAEVIKEYDIIL